MSGSDDEKTWFPSQATTSDPLATPPPQVRHALRERTKRARQGVLGIVHLVIPGKRLAGLANAIERCSAEIEQAAAFANLHLVHEGGLLRTLQGLAVNQPGPVIICWDRCDGSTGPVAAVQRRLDEISSEGGGLILIGDGLPEPSGPHARLLPEIKPILRVLLDACHERPVHYICNAFDHEPGSDGCRWDETLDKLIQRRRLKRLDPGLSLDRGEVVGVLGVDPQRVFESRAVVWALGGRPLVASPCATALAHLDSELLAAEIDRGELLEAATQRVVSHLERRGALRSGVIRLPVEVQVSMYRRGRMRRMM